LRRTFITVGLFLAWLLVPARVARAQEVSAYFSLGSAYVTSNGSQVDTFGDGILHKTPSLDGIAADLGASVFINARMGIGTQLVWKPSQGDYAGLKYRPSFYDFDGIFRPVGRTTKRLAPEFRAGIGGARVRYAFEDQTACDRVPGCPDSTHFQVHVSAAGRWYLSDHLFLRPAVDLHYVVNFKEFGCSWVPRYSMGIGYSFGRE
jgi:hypothetical protein